MEQGLLFPQISLTTPLVYFGGKVRAITRLMPYLPSGTTEVVSPFIGGGSFELAITGKGIRVHGYDAFPPLVNFWQKLLTRPNDLLEPMQRFS